MLTTACTPAASGRSKAVFVPKREERLAQTKKRQDGDDDHNGADDVDDVVHEILLGSGYPDRLVQQDRFTALKLPGALPTQRKR